MEINPGFLAPCGLYCGVCGVYYATRDENQEFLEKLLKMYQSSMPQVDELTKLTTEDLECNGCMSDRVSFFCRVCAIKTCTKEKGYAGCHECADFPCSHVEEFPMPVGKKVIMRTIPYWREHGTEKWVRDEESRYLCPECGHQLFRGAKRCNKCKTPIDVD